MSKKRAARVLAVRLGIEFESALRSWRRWEADQHVPSADHQDHVAAVLGVDLLELGPWPVPGRASTVEAATGLGTARRREMDRRLFLSAAGIMLSQLGLSGLHADPAAAAGRRVGMGEVQQVRAITQMYRAADNRFGGASLWREMVDGTDQMASLLRGQYTERVGRLLHRSIAEARQLAGWMAFDAGQHPQACRQWTLGEASAREADDRPLHAYILWSRTAQIIHIKPSIEAVDLIRTAREMADPVATPTTRGALAAEEAYALAKLGVERPAVDALADAAAAFDHANSAEDPSWANDYSPGFRFIEASANVYRALAMIDPQRYGGKGIDTTERAVAESSDGPLIRSHLFGMIGLAKAHFIAGEIDGGIDAGTNAVNAAQGFGSSRITNKLSALREAMLPYADQPAVRDLDENIRALTH